MKKIIFILDRNHAVTIRRFLLVGDLLQKNGSQSVFFDLSNELISEIHNQINLMGLCIKLDYKCLNDFASIPNEYCKFSPVNRIVEDLNKIEPDHEVITKLIEIENKSLQTFNSFFSSRIVNEQNYFESLLHQMQFFCESVRPDAVVFDLEMHTPVRALLLAARLNGIKIISMEHAEGYGEQYQKFPLLADYYFAYSYYNVKKLLDMGVNSENILLSGAPETDKLFELLNSHKKDENIRKIIIALKPSRNETFIRINTEMIEDVKEVFSGDKNWEIFIKQHPIDLSLKNKTDFMYLIRNEKNVHFVSGEQNIAEYYAKTDITICAYTSAIVESVILGSYPIVINEDSITGWPDWNYYNVFEKINIDGLKDKLLDVRKYPDKYKNSNSKVEQFIKYFRLSLNNENTKRAAGLIESVLSNNKLYEINKEMDLNKKRLEDAVEFINKKESNPKSETKELDISSYPFVSVVIPVFNGGETFKLCLDSISKLSYPKEKLEIIIVDNGSTDSSVEIAKEYNFNILFETSIKSSYAARNKGIQAAKGELIAFTDADCIVTKNWLNYLITYWGDENIGCFAGEIEAFKPKGAIEKFSDREGILRQEGTLSSNFLPYTQTANSAYRRTVFDKIGLFNPDLISGGDADIAWRMQKELGLKIKFIPEALVYHKHRINIDALYNQFKKYEQGKLLWKKFYPDIQIPSLEERKQELDNNIDYVKSSIELDSQKFINGQIDFAELIRPYLKYIMSLGTYSAQAELSLEKINVINNPGINEMKDSQIENFQEVIELAEDLIQKGNLPAARTKLDILLSLNPASVDALNDLAALEILEGNYLRANNIISYVLSIDPKNEVASGNKEYLTAEALSKGIVLENENLPHNQILGGNDSSDIINALPNLYKISELLNNIGLTSTEWLKIHSSSVFYSNKIMEKYRQSYAEENPLDIQFYNYDYELMKKHIVSFNAPWLKYPLPDFKIPGMITDEEKQYYLYITKFYQGIGEVLELGPWLGCSTSYISKGLKRNPNFKEKLFVYDDFLWRSSWMDGYYNETDRPKNHENFQHIFERFTADFKDIIETEQVRISNYDGNEKIKQLSWNKGSIEIAFIDCGRNIEANEAWYRILSPYFIPDKTLLVLQDWQTHKEVPVQWYNQMKIFTDSKSEKLELIHEVSNGGVATFLFRG